MSKVKEYFHDFLMDKEEEGWWMQLDSDPDWQRKLSCDPKDNLGPLGKIPTVEEIDDADNR